MGKKAVMDREEAAVNIGGLQGTWKKGVINRSGGAERRGKRLWSGTVNGQRYEEKERDAGREGKPSLLPPEEDATTTIATRGRRCRCHCCHHSPMGGTPQPCRNSEKGFLR